MPKQNGRRKVMMKTELGLQVETTVTHRDAVYLAQLKEEIEERQEALRRGLDRILDQMKLDGIESCTVKAPGGSLFTVAVEASDLRVKIKKAQKPERPIYAEDEKKKEEVGSRGPHGLD